MEKIYSLLQNKASVFANTVFSGEVVPLGLVLYFAIMAVISYAIVS